MIDVLRTVYRPFAPFRRITEYLGQSGQEVGGLALPPGVLESHAGCLVKDLPEEFVVTGIDERSDDKWFLRFAITRAYIEAVSDFRDVDREHKQLIYICPDCEGRSGKHSKSCRQ